MWCNPKGINNLLNNPNNPAPTGPNLANPSPNLVKPPNIVGQIKNNNPDTATITNDVIIGTDLLPLKKAKKSGNSVLWNLLYNSAAIIPDKIPMKGFSILAKAAGTSSGATCIN